MESGVTYVRTNLYHRSLIDAPTGWLFNHKRGLLIFFESYKKSQSNNLKVYTHLFYSNQLGKPFQHKNSRLHSIECAYETWNELIAGGWQIVTDNFQNYD